MLTIFRFLIFLCLLKSIELFEFEDAQTSGVTFGSWSETDGIQTISMDENNDEGTILVLITGATQPTIDTDFMDGDSSLLDATIELDGSNYCIKINKQVDYEALEKPKRFLFQVTDDSDEKMINLVINNLDDNPPYIKTQNCAMKENTTYTISNATCSYEVGDADGLLDQMTFTIVPTDKNEDKIFVFEYKTEPADTDYTADVYLVLQDGQLLDYEQLTLYVFVLQAEDGAGHSTNPLANVSITVQVEDIPDENPIWESFVSLRTFPEEQETTFTVKARDGDFGINAEINYKVDDPNNFTTIDTTTGDVTIAKVDRDKGYDTIEFTITAYEADDNTSFVTQDLTFVVSDINDNIPKITIDNSDNRTIDIEIDENYSNSLDVNINIDDIDLSTNAMYTTHLVNNNSINYTAAFQVIPTRGYQSSDFYISVLNSTYLDYEDSTWRIITFILEAYDDVDNDTMKDSIPVTIRLLDVNDESPIFDNTNGIYNASVPENVDLNYLVATVHATDKDAGDVVTHSIIGTSSNSILTIDSETGEITTKLDRSFDYEKQSEVFVQILAVDKVDHQTTAELTITIEDVNDEPPTLTVSSTTTIQENRANGSEIPDLSITADDVDTTADLHFSINWDESYATKNSIRINDTLFNEYHCIDVETIADSSNNKVATAKLTILETKVNNTPDFEIFDTLFLSLQVTDNNTVEGEATVATTIVIKIENINDNAPEFSSDVTSTKRSVTENSDINITVSTITASDADNLQALVYSIEGTDDDTKDWITINEKTGELLVNSNIDCDDPVRDNITYQISAFDGNFTTTVTIVISILDQNDNSPVMSDIVVSVAENSDSSTILYTFNATDKDRDESFRTITYSFQASDLTDDIKNNFAITESDDGDYQLSVATTADIDYESGTTSYEFSVICRDNPENIGTITNSVPVKTTITVIDVNDNTPYVVTTEIAAIKENLEEGDTVVDAIEGEDLDSPGYYSDIDFKILKIERFSDSNHETDITGNLSQTLFSLSTDKDYSSKKATLNINDDLEGLYGYYRLTIQTNDFNGTDSPENYKNDNTVYLEVKKFNFKAPTFKFPETEGALIYLSNSQTINSQLWLWNHQEKLQNIKATDNQNDKYNIQFTLKDENDIFTLIDGVGQSQAQLQLTTEDVEEHKQYTVTITANVDPNNTQTTGEASYTVTRSAIFQFIDLDSEPIFDQNTTTVNFTEEEDGLSEERTIPQASYDGVDLNMTIYYILLQQDDYEYFNVNQSNGVITLKKIVDYEVVQNLTIIIQASNSDSINTKAADNTRLTVTVDVIDINDNPPIFKSDRYYGGIKTTYPLQTVILDIEATDADVADTLKFAINTSSITTSDDSLSKVTNPFVLADVSNGVVELRLNFTVQVNMQGFFTFPVTVQDQREPIHTNTTEVKVFIVTDDNVVNFKFENPLTQVQNQLDDIKTILTNQFGADCATETPTPDTSDGVQLDNQTLVPAYFIDENTNQPLDKDDILNNVSDITVYAHLRTTFLNETLILMSFDANTTTDDNLEATLRAWLIGVSVTLGALCLILLIVFVIKTRSLSRRITKLTEPKFGSQESGLNRQGIAAPTTNKHAVEGSNPVYNNEIDTKEIDRESIGSGDSEFIGVEELPEFNYDLEQHNDDDL